MKNKLLTRLTDKLILRPTRHPIEAAGKRHVFSYRDGQLEVWIQHRKSIATAEPNLYVLEFPGTASRAEKPGGFLEGAWSDAVVEIWSVNPPGYGGSSGSASLQRLPGIAGHAFDELQQAAQGHPVVVAGGSLGSVSALYLAATREVGGVLVQNPPDLREVIFRCGARWPLRWAAPILAQQIPTELDSIRNAARATAPAVFVLAMSDQIVPTSVQQQVFNAYAGPKRVIELSDADHDTPLSEYDKQRLYEMKVWLRQNLADSVTD